MIQRGHGTIIYTSATAAYRGNRGQHAHTMGMGGRMRLTQSLNAELGPQGIHIVHVNMDGLINAVSDHERKTNYLFLSSSSMFVCLEPVLLSEQMNTAHEKLPKDYMCTRVHVCMCAA